MCPTAGWPFLVRNLQRKVTGRLHMPTRLLAEGFRFALVGVCATLTYLLASYAARTLGGGHYVANIAGYLSSVAVSYFGHAIFTFRSTQPHATQWPKFAIVSLTTFGLTNIIIFVAVDLMGWSSSFASLVVACSIPVISWLLSRYWVFRMR